MWEYGSVRSNHLEWSGLGDRSCVGWSSCLLFGLNDWWSCIGRCVRTTFIGSALKSNLSNIWCNQKDLLQFVIIHRQWWMKFPNYPSWSYLAWPLNVLSISLRGPTFHLVISILNLIYLRSPQLFNLFINYYTSKCLCFFYN